MYGTQLCPLSGLSFTGNQTVVSETFGVDMRQLWGYERSQDRYGRSREESTGAFGEEQENIKTLTSDGEQSPSFFFLFLSSQDIEGAREVRMGDR